MMAVIKSCLGIKSYYLSFSYLNDNANEKTLSRIYKPNIIPSLPHSTRYHCMQTTWILKDNPFTNSIYYCRTLKRNVYDRAKSFRYKITNYIKTSFVLFQDPDKTIEKPFHTSMGVKFVLKWAYDKTGMV